MPFDPTVAIIFGTLLTSLLFSLLYAVWYQQFKHKHKISKHGSQDSSRSIGVSELEELICKAVAEATLSLNDRLDVLAEEVQSLEAVLGEERKRALSQHKGKPLLDLPDTEAEEFFHISSGRRVR